MSPKIRAVIKHIFQAIGSKWCIRKPLKLFMLKITCYLSSEGLCNLQKFDLCLHYLTNWPFSELITSMCWKKFHPFSQKLLLQLLNILSNRRSHKQKESGMREISCFRLISAENRSTEVATFLALFIHFIVVYHQTHTILLTWR